MVLALLLLVAAAAAALGGEETMDAGAFAAGSQQARASAGADVPGGAGAVLPSAGRGSRAAFRAAPSEKPDKAVVWRRVNGAGKRVALTFDDGNAAAWRSMLDTLKAHKAHASFFVLGPHAAASPGLMHRTVAEGHGIGSHGWSHTNMAVQSATSVSRELRRSAEPWTRATGTGPAPYVRPPFGYYSRGTLRGCAEAGFTRVILWDVDPRDWRQPNAEVIASRVLKRVRSGSIVCLHLLPQTAAALPSILSGLRDRGYEAVSLPELFRAAGYR